MQRTRSRRFQGVLQAFRRWAPWIAHLALAAVLNTAFDGPIWADEIGRRRALEASLVEAERVPAAPLPSAMVAAAAPAPPIPPPPSLPDLPQEGSRGPAPSVAEAAPASEEGVPLIPGWNLISLPKQPDSIDPAAVFSSIAGSFSIVHTYEACDAADPWRTYNPAAAPGDNDLTSVDHRPGLWVRATAAATLAISGTEPAETSIQLCQGWNLIGYPLAQPRPVLAALSSIAGKFLRVYGWDPADPVDPWEVFDVAVPAWANDLEQMQPGRGYWLYATEDTTLVMSNAGLPPEVEITSPANAATITAPTDIVGTVKSDLLEQWTLAYRLKGETGAFTTFASGNTPVANGVLGRFDPTLLLNGLYEIELTATDFQGQSTSVLLDATLEGEMKIGHFTLPFLDVELPVLGLPIQVVRTYDSRDKRKGDFGYGWTLTLTEVRLQENIAPGDEWQGTRSGGLFPTYCIRPVRLHVVSVVLPSGEVLRFTPRPSPECQALAPPQVVSLHYEPLPGTRGTLEPLDRETQALVVGSFPGPVQLWEQASTSLQDPDLYRLTVPDGRSFVIDQREGLRSLTDRNGNVLTFQPNGIVHSSGPGITFQRDSEGRVTRITDPLSNSVIYTYDARGDLVSVTDQEGLITRFTYLDNHFLHTIIDPDGRQIVAAEYDVDGRLKKRCNGSNQCADLVHDLSANREIHTDATGRSLTYIYDDQGNVLSVTDALQNTTRYEYDAAGNKTKKIDATGAVTSYSYDSRDNMLSTTLPHPAGAPASEYTTTYTYNSRDQITSVTLPTGAQTRFDYDTAGNLKEIRDGSGNLLLSRELGPGGAVVSETDPFGTTTYANLTPAGESRLATDPLGGTVTAAYDANGQITGMVEGSTITSTFTYDRRGRELTSQYSHGPGVEYTYGARDEWTEMSGPSLGTVRRELDVSGRVTSWTMADGQGITYDYDAAGRLLEQKPPLSPATRFDYDEVGRVRKATGPDGGETSYVYDPAGRPTEQTDALGHKIQLRYTPEGRLERLTDQKGKVWKFDLGVTSTTTTDPLDRPTTVRFSPDGLPIETLHPDGTSFQVSYLPAAPLMDREEYPTSVKDEGGHVRDYTYDAVGRLATAEDLAGVPYTYNYSDDGQASIVGPTGEPVLALTYDSLANVKTVTYADGGTNRYDYDAANLLSTITRPSGAAVSLAYDTSGRITGRTTPGESAVFEWNAEDALTRTVDTAGTTTYSYDTTGNLSGIEIQNGASVQYTRDRLGRMETVSFRTSAGATPFVTRYGYDPAGNLTSVRDPLGGLTTFEYDDAHRPIKRTLPNGITTDFRYNLRDQITAVEHRNPGGDLLVSSTYERQGVGEPTRITREDGSFVLLEYDSALRLTREAFHDPSGILIESRSYTYDAAGNRQTATSSTGASTYTYQPGYKLTAVNGPAGAESYGYDADGRVRSIARDGTTWTLEHDALDQLRSVSGGASLTYSYNALGWRVRAADASGERRFLKGPTASSELESVHMISDEAGALLAGYVYAGPYPLLRFGPDGPVYYLTDGMGSTVGLADASGAAAARFQYDAFGNLRSSSGPLRDAPPALGGDFRFHGAWLEAATGLYHFRQRDYDPRVGRFLARDPAEPAPEIPESTHPYLFANANPHLYTDPTGAFTLVSVNINLSVQGVVQGIRAAAVNQLRSYLRDKVGEIVTKILVNTVQSILPLPEFEFFAGLPDDRLSRLFENGVRDLLCEFLGPGLTAALWFEPVIQQSDGKPIGNGWRCGDRGREASEGAVRFKPGNREPDFLFKQGEPKNTNKKALVVGEIKIGIRTFYYTYLYPGRGYRPGQWSAMWRHAREYQYPPYAVLFVAFFKDQTHQWRALRRMGIARRVALIIFSVQ